MAHLFPCIQAALAAGQETMGERRADAAAVEVDDVLALLQRKHDALIESVRTACVNEAEPTQHIERMPLRRQISTQGSAGCIADAGPDAWGQRVIMNRMLGAGARDEDPATLSPLTYLLQSGSDRIGALDFQSSSSNYLSRQAGTASLEEMMQSAQRVEEGTARVGAATPCRACPPG